MLVSTIWGSVLNSEYGVVGDNIKRLLQYSISFEYLFFFRYYFSKHRPKMKKILYCFIIFVVSLAVLFQMNPTVYSSICSLWNKGNSYIASSFLDSVSYGYTLRYGFILDGSKLIFAYALAGIINVYIDYFFKVMIL